MAFPKKGWNARFFHLPDLEGCLGPPTLDFTFQAALLHTQTAGGALLWAGPYCGREASLAFSALAQC